MFQLSALIDGIKTLKNKTLKISLETQDISMFSPEELGELFKLNDKQIWVAFKEEEVDPEDLDVKMVKMEEKSPSSRLRSCLWVYWDKNKPTTTFDEFYNRKIEEFIKLVKEKIS